MSRPGKEYYYIHPGRAHRVYVNPVGGTWRVVYEWADESHPTQAVFGLCACVSRCRRAHVQAAMDAAADDLAAIQRAYCAPVQRDDLDLAAMDAWLRIEAALARLLRYGRQVAS